MMIVFSYVEAGETLIGIVPECADGDEKKGCEAVCTILRTVLVGVMSQAWALPTMEVQAGRVTV